MHLSIIIPSFHGADILKRNIPGLINYFKEKSVQFEIIIVDDGSNDNGSTENIANQLQCKFLKHEKNLGKGASVRNGILTAEGAFRIYTDVDVPFEYVAFERFVNYLEVKEFDMVIGDRTLPDSKYFVDVSRLRFISSKIFSFIIGRFIIGGYFDSQCGMKGFRAAVANDLFSVSKINGFAFDVELIYIALKRNYDIKRLPVVLKCQEGSSVRVIRHGFRMLIDLLIIIWNHKMGFYKKL
ncbi:MAG: glycosyltransferase [Bacteroidota bacterium]